jgi:hypothetical protein
LFGGSLSFSQFIAIALIVLSGISWYLLSKREDQQIS